MANSQGMFASAGHSSVVVVMVSALVCAERGGRRGVESRGSDLLTADKANLDRIGGACQQCYNSTAITV